MDMNELPEEFFFLHPQIEAINFSQETNSFPFFVTWP